VSKTERLGRILELLARDGSVAVSVLAEELGVSEATVRRDLQALGISKAFIQGEADFSRMKGPGEQKVPFWLSLVIHHIPDLAGAAREIRRVLRPGAPVLIRPGRI